MTALLAFAAALFPAPRNPRYCCSISSRDVARIAVERGWIRFTG